MTLHGEGEDHVVRGGDGVGLEELEELAEHPARHPAVHDLPDHLAWGTKRRHLKSSELPHSFGDWQTCDREEGHKDIRQSDVEKHCPAPSLAKSVPG